MKKAVILLLFLLLLQFYQDTNAYEKIEYVKVPNNIYVTNASMKIIPVSNPMKPCIDIGDDGIIDWAFDGIGYGSMGEQNFFGENKSKTIEFEKNAKINITLPKLANISNAELEVSFKKEQKFSQIEKIGIGKGMITSIEICDIDNDGDLDIAYGVGSLFGVELSEGGFYVSINSNGSYADIKPIDLIGMSIQEIKSGDMDKNGYIDFVGAGGNGNFYFLKNYGLHFSREVIKVGNGMMNAIALADLDNDGKEDIIGGSSTGTVYFSKATNNGSFENATQIAKTGYAILKIITGDMDNDYDIDIVVGGSKYLSYLENKNNNFEIKQIALGEDVKQVFDIKICDIDSDGDMDIITSAGKTELAVGSKGYIYKLINNGKEFSAPLIMKKFDEFALFSIEIGDIDFDGEIDIVGGTTNFKFLLLKKEKDSFKDILIDGNASNIINELGLGDIDNDGDLDLVGGCGDGFLYFSKNLLFMNYDTEINILGNKIFSKKSPSFSTPLKIRSGSNKKIMSVLVRDINKDGKKDIIGGNSNGDIYIAYNENETFENVKKIIGNFSSDIYSIKTLDKDNDGNLDIAASIYSVSSNSSPFLFFVSEKKNGNFSNSYIHSNDVGDYASATLSIDIGDIDSDGDTDIVCAGTLQDLKNFTLYGRVYLCLNENSNFSNVSILKEMAGGIGDLKLIDMNRDGKLDIVFGHTTISLESEVYILFNENSSFKNEKKLYAGKDLITGISIGDLDLDGDMDIVCGKANVFNPYKESDILYFENILNEFEYRTVFTAPAEIIHLILGDLDRNGYLDIVACSIDGNFYIIKNQLGNLSENITIHSGGGAVFGIDIEDINNDGTYEIIGGNNDTNFYVIKQKEQSFSESIDFSSNAKLAVKEMIGVVDHYGNEMVNISLELFSKEKTKLTFSNLSIVYNYVANLLDFSKVLNRYIEKYKTMEKEVKIPIKKSVEKGDILLSEFEIEYNSKPVILSSSPENKTYINEGGSKKFNITAFDSDNDTLFFEWYLNDQLIEVGSSSYTFNTNFSSSSLIPYNIKVVIKDKYFNISYNWELFVKNVNRAPYITDFYPKENQTMDINGSQLFRIDALDPDNDKLFHSWYINEKIVPNPNSTYLFFPNFSGLYEIEVRVTDGEFEINKKWLVKVNETPIIEEEYEVAKEQKKTSIFLYIILISVFAVAPFLYVICIRSLLRRKEVKIGENETAGMIFMVKEKGYKKSCMLLKKLASFGISPLVITPKEISLGIDARIIRLTVLEKEAKPTITLVSALGMETDTLIINGKECVRADDIEKIADILREFMGTNERSVILLAGIEYLIVENDFGTLLRFIQSMKEYVSLRNARMIIPVDPTTLEEKEIVFLERETVVL